jgi:hypothetical protein
MKAIHSTDGNFKLEGQSLYYSTKNAWLHVFTSHKIQNIEHAKRLLDQFYETKKELTEVELEIYNAL